jgi:hypothetical protein
MLMHYLGKASERGDQLEASVNANELLAKLNETASSLVSNNSRSGLFLTNLHPSIADFDLVEKSLNDGKEGRFFL